MRYRAILHGPAACAAFDRPQIEYSNDLRRLQIWGRNLLAGLSEAQAASAYIKIEETVYTQVDLLRPLLRPAEALAPNPGIVLVQGQA